MCGRYSRTVGWAQVRAFSAPLAIATPDTDPEPAWNIAPSQSSWVLVAGPGGSGALARRMRWGLVPAWAKAIGTGYITINARVETAAAKPAYRGPWRHRRCLVPASGWYEWPRPRQPVYIHPQEAPVALFAGLWEHWPGTPEQPGLDSFSIVTTEASGPLRSVHDRMPLLLSAAVLSDWLHGDGEAAAAIAAAAQPPELAWHRVAPAVGNVRAQGAGLVEPLPGDPIGA